MKELTKGTLVMTEVGIRVYFEEIDINSEAFQNGFKHLVTPLNETPNDVNVYAVAEAITLTRAQVEEKIKEMGWYINQYGFTKQGYKVCLDGFGDVKIITPIFSEDNFDTATAQLGEAILVAKLLNATKD
jgi:hypothetical protein